MYKVVWLPLEQYNHCHLRHSIVVRILVKTVVSTQMSQSTQIGVCRGYHFLLDETVSAAVGVSCSPCGASTSRDMEIASCKQYILCQIRAPFPQCNNVQVIEPVWLLRYALSDVSTWVFRSRALNLCAYALARAEACDIIWSVPPKRILLMMCWLKT